MQNTKTVRRTTAERRRDTLERLDTERDLWVSTAHPERGPHQVPLWFRWDGRAVWLCTAAASLTARNAREDPRVRLALPDTHDVVLLQGTAECFPTGDAPAAAESYTAKFGWDPRTEQKPHLYLRVLPETVRAWRGGAEQRGRLLMRAGTWLE
ncbi:pyridoxamine 5'-phosphate oxidase family protein [Kitasatospora sp. NPDC088134]|uniref:pyridoxamine 5'-phosphate oxidase family protein n=1 Tax=Kitasatospora sp. NPDC088134 TaxID=3364071 RepID=UPI003823506F